MIQEIVCTLAKFVQVKDKVKALKLDKVTYFKVIGWMDSEFEDIKLQAMAFILEALEMIKKKGKDNLEAAMGRHTQENGLQAKDMASDYGPPPKEIAIWDNGKKE